MENKANGLGVGSLVCGIVSLVFAWTGILALIGLAAGIVAIVLSVRSKKQPGKSGMATAGLVTGIIGTVLSGIFVICALACAAAITDAINNLP